MQRRANIYRKSVLILALILSVLSPLTLITKNSASLAITLLGYLLLILSTGSLVLISYIVFKNFKKEITELKKEGLQVQSMAGFDTMQKKIKISNFKTGLIFLNAAIALLIFVIILDSSLKISVVILATAITASLLSCAGIIYAIPIPELKFTPGMLSKYYSSPDMPLILNYMLIDTIRSGMDPATKLKFDEWTNLVENSVNKKFAITLERVTRTELAKQSLLLLTYLKESMPITGDAIFEKKIQKIIEPSKIEQIKTGGKSGISIEVLEELIKNAITNSPGIFKIIDRLITTILENIEDIENQKILVEVHSTPKTNQLKPIKMVVFIINIAKEYSKKPRDIMLTIQGKPHPLKLDEYSINLKDYEKQLINTKSGKKDAIDLLIELLRMGTAIQTKIKPLNWGEHVVNIEIKDQKDPERTLWGDTFTYKVSKDYTVLIVPALTAIAGLGGTIISILGITMGTIAHLLETIL